jgi:2',3'-cyclic-nucleotide 2'-phosphodiesterase (5'-nucleotidase family)
VKVGGKNVDPKRTYKVVTSDFLYDGGDHLGPALTGRPVLERGATIRDAMYTWASRQTQCFDAVSGVRDRVIVGGC